MKRLLIYDRELLSILYPEYSLKSNLYELVPKSLYVGSEKVLPQHSQVQDCLFVIRTLSDDIDILLSDRWAVYLHACERKGKKPLKSLQRYISRIDEDDFKRELRLFMATGKWVKATRPHVKTYELFDAFTQNQADFLKLYFSLREIYSFNEMFSSILTFFKKVVSHNTRNETDVTDYYDRVIEKMKVHTKEIKKTIHFLVRNHFDEVTFLDFLIGVRYGTKR